MNNLSFIAHKHKLKQSKKVKLHFVKLSSSEKEGPEGGILTEGKVEVFIVDINKFERVDTWLQKVSLPTAREGNIVRSVCQSFCPRGQGGVGFPACISGHMTRGLHPGVCIWGSVSRGVCIGGLHQGWRVCIWRVCIQMGVGKTPIVCLGGSADHPNDI